MSAHAITRTIVRPEWLSDTNVDELAQLGFTSISALCPPSDLVILRTELTRLFAAKAGSREGKFYDMLELDATTRPTLPTLLNASNYAPQLKRLECLKRTAIIARWLLGPDAVLNLEHAILKPARYGAPTPWHQDEAYRRESEFKYNQVSFWFPLDDATEESGCLHFVPGSNLGDVLPHRSHRNNTGVYALECIEPSGIERAVVVPVKAGDCSAHTGRTLHGAGPNHTQRPRYAYILEYEATPVPLPQKREFSWHKGRHPPSWVARGRWLRRGGIVIETFRRFREGLFTPGRLKFEMRRSLRVLRSFFF
jgi:Phytanoyl-CoA dioxygenase (PhyH)